MQDSAHEQNQTMLKPRTSFIHSYLLIYQKGISPSIDPEMSCIHSTRSLIPLLLAQSRPFPSRSEAAPQVSRGRCPRCPNSPRSRAAPGFETAQSCATARACAAFYFVVMNRKTPIVARRLGSGQGDDEV